MQSHQLSKRPFYVSGMDVVTFLKAQIWLKEVTITAPESETLVQSREENLMLVTDNTESVFDLMLVLLEMRSKQPLVFYADGELVEQVPIQISLCDRYSCRMPGPVDSVQALQVPS